MIETSQFRAPAREFRSAPFWSWNDDLQEAELIRQIGLMDSQGIGGFFMHSRVGLVTPYLSHDWMNRIRACVDEAKRHGMLAWLYDEDKWPSGFAGGLVTAPNPAHRTKALVLRPAPIYYDVAESMATFAATLREGRVASVHRLEAPPADPFDSSPDRLYLHFFLWTASLGNEWFNSFAYADLLDPDAVRAYIDANYEPYRLAFGSEFGGAIPGIFTDEPCYLSLREGTPRPRVPWTTRLADSFTAAHGYDVRDHLPSLFYDVGDFPAVRYDFWRTVTDLFVDSFTRQVGEWCERHGAKLTGHVLMEDTLLSQTLTTGAAMPHYEYMHQPGMDHLSRNIANPLTAKQLDSAACQFGGRRTLSELFGCSGQNMSFVDRKWIADWHLVLGINYLNPHLSLYSMRGARKRDYPPNLYFQQPWWHHASLFEDYAGRLCYALTRGKREVDLLVVHPISSAWTLYRPEGSHELLQLDVSFAELVETLLGIQRDFHLGDDRILAGHGGVEGGRLRVGEMSYSAVLVPSQSNLARSTFKLLEQFADSGGPVVAIEPVPTRLDGRLSDELAAFFARPSVRRIGSDRDELAGALAWAASPKVTVRGLNGADARAVWYHLRQDGDRTILFVANTDRWQPCDVAVEVSAEGPVESWDASTGAIEAIASEEVGQRTRIRLHLEPAGSQLLVLGGQPTEARRPTAAASSRALTFGGDWRLRRLDPNSLPLDYCEYWLPALPSGLAGTSISVPRPDVAGQGGWSRRVPVWRANRGLRGDQVRGGTAGNWFNVQPGIEQPFALRFRLEVSPDLAESPGQLGLVVETPERFSVTLNGAPIPTPSDDWWIDPCWRPSDIRGLVRPGENVVEIRGTFFHDTELESIYVVGDFAVERTGTDEAPGFRLIPWSDSTGSSARLEQRGLPFYAGRVVLAQDYYLESASENASIELEAVDAAVVEVRVNGRRAGAVSWHPWRVAVEGLLQPGRNTVELELDGTLHNLLGPHHHRDGELHSVNPNSFFDEVAWKDSYTIVPFGVGGTRLLLPGE